MAIHNRDPKTGRIISTQSIEERFWSHVQICEHGRTCTECCWPWTAKIDDGGYGHFAITSKKDIGAHRMAFFLTYGRLDPSLLTCHNCPSGDLRSCCQPSHLWEGTDAENSEDMVCKGRSLTGEKNPGFINKTKVREGVQKWVKEHPEQHARGETSGNASITDEQARYILSLKGTMKPHEARKLTSASRMTIWSIWSGYGWKHIQSK
jgi:hypothetical protein